MSETRRIDCPRARVCRRRRQASAEVLGWSLKALARTAIAALLALGVAIAAPSSASAGTYRAAQCKPTWGAGHADASFTANSSHYASAAGCGEGGEGLTVTPDAPATHGGSWGAWTLPAPAGTELVGAAATVSGRGQGGHVPEVLVGGLGGSPRTIGRAAGDPHRVEWSGAAGEALSARLRCAREECGSGHSAIVKLKRVVLKLEDSVAPTLEMGGGLFAPGSRRGQQPIEPFASDLGGGVRRVLVDINGQPIASQGMHCELAGALALRLRPCPARAIPSFSAATDSAPFVQGPNTVRVCAMDYAPDSTANRACETRTVRVDNDCPLSEVPDGAQLEALIDGGDRAQVGRGETATVEGRLLDAQGAGVAGARVCVAARVPLDGEAEKVVASPHTGAGGGFSVELPAGPSREVRVAYWPSAVSAVERTLGLETRADPRLRLRPRRRLRNGERCEFAIRIPAPRNGRRQVRLQVRSGGRWLNLRDGRTDAAGRWRTSYRFHATTGTRRYAFRAVVPAQDGYPYAAGHSPVRHVTVVGS